MAILEMVLQYTLQLPVYSRKRASVRTLADVYIIVVVFLLRSNKQPVFTVCLYTLGAIKGRIELDSSWPVWWRRLSWDRARDRTS